MEGTIVNYKRSRHVQKGNHLIIAVSGVASKEKAQELVGKDVMWTTPAKKEMKGKVASSHGNKGAIRVIFETGMPGQSLGKKVEIK